MKINKLMLGLVAISVLVTSYLFQSLDFSLDDKLIIGVANGYAPFVSMNHLGEYEGFDIDIAHLVAKKMDKKLVICDLGSMTGLLAGLDQEKVNLLIWGLSITQSRLQKANMIHYYGDSKTHCPLIFWGKIPVNVTKLQDLAGQVVCVEAGSIQESMLDQYHDIKKLVVERVDDALLNIQYGKAVAALVDPAIARKFSAKLPQIQKLDLLLTPQQAEHGIGIMLKKDQSELFLAVQQAVMQLKEQGQIDLLAQKWGLVE